MRVSTTLLKGPGRRPQHKLGPFPFKESFPLQIRNSVEGTGGKTADVSCLQEMAVMFACMKKNEFKDIKCSPEIAIFLQCYSKHKEEKLNEKQREQSGQVITGRNPRNLSKKQLNELLAKFPQYNEKL